MRIEKRRKRRIRKGGGNRDRWRSEKREVGNEGAEREYVRSEAKRGGGRR
jgi:hypothetical protein